MRRLQFELVRWFCYVVTTVLGFLPTELWLLANHFVNPNGFWQKFAMVGGGFVVLGGIQLVLFVAWCVFMWAFTFEYKYK